MTQTEEKQTTPDETALEVQTTPEVKKRPQFQMWYHESDFELLGPINPFFSHLQRRLPQVQTCLLSYKPTPVAPKLYDNTDYFRQRYQEHLVEYQQKKQEHEEKHQAALAEPLAGLQRTALFVPCVSYAFLEAFERDLATSPELAKALENPQFQIMPIVLRPVETGTFSMRPLCTYAEGHEREIALKELVAVMERLLCDALRLEPRTTALDYLFGSSATIQPVIASQATTRDLVLEALEPVKHLVEQASAQVVEARQLAISERSEQQTVESLAQEVEALRQQVQAQSSGFWSRFRAKKS